MRRIVLFLSLVFMLPGVGLSQVEEDEPLKAYLKPHFYTSVNYYGFGLDLDFEHQIAERMYLKTDLGVYFAPISNHVFGTSFSIALKYRFNEYLFALFDMQPNMRLQGIEHQINGDYLTFYIRNGIGVGTNIDFGEYHQVYMEAKLCGDVVLYDELHVYHGSVYLMVGVGYRYKFF